MNRKDAEDIKEIHRRLGVLSRDLNRQTADLANEIEAIKRKLGMAGTEPECHGEYMTSGDLKKAAKHEECVQYLKKWAKGQRQKPDLPLNARVAKALGWKVHQKTEGEIIWYGKPPKIANQNIYQPPLYEIPDYPNDLPAAMGALEEYGTRHDLSSSITIVRPNSIDKEFKYHVFVGPGGTYSHAKSNSLPQAICEAIVKHAEGI